MELGPRVGATITTHHLALTVDDWAGNVHNYCKPVAKFYEDREALRNVVKSGIMFIRNLIIQETQSSFLVLILHLIQRI
jgi:dihydroorotase